MQIQSNVNVTTVHFVDKSLFTFSQHFYLFIMLRCLQSMTQHLFPFISPFCFNKYEYILRQFQRKLIVTDDVSKQGNQSLHTG